MTDLKTKWLPLAAVVASLWGGGMTGAQAAQISLTLDTEFSGASMPSNTYKAVFDDGICGTDCVRLTMSITGSNTNEFIGDTQNNFGWGFNFDPMKTLGSLIFTGISGNLADIIAISTDAYKADGNGFYDFVFGWSNRGDGGRLNAGETAVYDITGISGLKAVDFKFLSACPDGQTCGNGSWLSAAHVQGIGSTTNDSGWIGDDEVDNGTPPQEVPEPGPLSLVGLGLMGLWFARRKTSA